MLCRGATSMNLILSVAIAITLLTSALIVIRFYRLRLAGADPLPLGAFMAILFTSGLDVGLIMFPLTEFPTYEADAEYGFTNALAIEFGFWGFLVWGFYFLTTFYFCVVEPKLKLFELRPVKLINAAVIIATCAFTGFLFLTYLPSYIVGITPFARYGLVGLVVLVAVLSSTDEFLASAANIGGYFQHIHKFISPISDYHAFYLFWWFAWSIMIGQFVARFVGGLTVWQLLLALLILPSIPIALWFSLLFYIYNAATTLSVLPRLCMVVVGVIFVVNSLDSLIRLYSENLNLTVARLTGPGYVAAHWALIFGLILLYQFTPLKIEWIGLVVIGIYCSIYVLAFLHRARLTTPSTPKALTE